MLRPHRENAERGLPPGSDRKHQPSSWVLLQKSDRAVSPLRMLTRAVPPSPLRMLVTLAVIAALARLAAPHTTWVLQVSDLHFSSCQQSSQASIGSRETDFECAAAAAAP